MSAPSAVVRAVGARLARHYGPLHWWPAETPFEVVVGAVLTQNTAWTNVERAITNLKCAGVLTPAALRALSADTLEAHIRPSGTYRVKARRLRALLDWLGEDWEHTLAGPTGAVRTALLAVPGVGAETADAILLYAAGHPTFVIDAYTRRIMTRIGVTPAIDSYEAWQALFMGALPPDAPVFNAYHAGLVQLGKDACRTTPCCAGCPLAHLCATGRAALSTDLKTVWLRTASGA